MAPIDFLRLTLEYDQVSNRTALTDSLGVTRYVYDELNRLKQVTDPFTGTVQYRYDPASNRTQVIYPDGKIVTSTFDAADRLSGTLSWDGQVTGYAFDRAGRLVTTTLPNGVVEVNTYDDANRVTRLTHSRSGTTLADYQFALDGLGNRVAVTETVQQPVLPNPLNETAMFAYDPLYRLTNAAYSGAYTNTFGYAYDAVGNRTMQTRTITSTQVTNYLYDAANRLTQAGGVTYTWDNNGNLINDGSANSPCF